MAADPADLNLFCLQFLISGTYQVLMRSQPKANYQQAVNAESTNQAVVIMIWPAPTAILAAREK